MYLIIILLMLGMGGKALGQAPDTLWTRTYDVDSVSVLTVAAAANGDILLGGQRNTQNGSLGWAMRVDSNGDSLWSRTFGGSGYNSFVSAILLPDNSFALAGFKSRYDNPNNYDYWLVKLNDAGDTIWTRTFGGDGYEYCSAAAVADDGGILLGGYGSFLGSPGTWVVKTDQNGLYQWSSLSQSPTGNPTLFGLSADGHNGATWAGQSPETSYDAFLMRIDDHGDSLWSATYEEVGGQYLIAISRMTDGGYVTGGYSEPIEGGSVPDMLAIRANRDGELQWMRRFSAGTCRSIVRRSNGDSFLIGDSAVFWETYTRVLVIDSTGQSTGSRIMGEVSTAGGVATYDGGIVIAGSNVVSGNLASPWLCRFEACQAEPVIPLLLLLGPNGGESWQLFGTDTVRWFGAASASHVRIELNRAFPTGPWEVLADSVANTGSDVVNITGPVSDYCRIRVAAIGDTLSDISNADFSIDAAQGYLALVRTNAPNAPVLTWNPSVECPFASAPWFRVKNFGSESIVVFQPLEPATSEFSRTTTCGAFFALAPNQMSACSVQVVFDPASDGTYSDVLRVQTDAVNGVNGFVEIGLSGEQISTPAAPEVVISTMGEDARLSWAVVDSSLGGCDVTVERYLVFYAPSSNGPYYYHGWTADTTYVHTGVVEYADGMFYQVVAVDVGAAMLVELLPGMDMGEVLGKIGNWK